MVRLRAKKRRVFRPLALVGIDLSDEFLNVLKRDAEAAGVAVGARRDDMRALDLGTGQFVSAFCFRNSFGYLDAAEAVTFLKSLARGAKPGGRVAIDIGTVAESGRDAPACKAMCSPRHRSRRCLVKLGSR